MTILTFAILVFLAVGSFFLFIHLMIGKLIRPAIPEEDKLAIYECGEPTVGSSWIQFDLRYYVVALLFVIFDVEVAFFFPWAVVFGQANEISHTVDRDKQVELSRQFNPAGLPPLPNEKNEAVIEADTAKSFAWLAMIDIGVFFGILMMGFAYLWRRGDIDWVRSTSHSPPISDEGIASLPPLPEVDHDHKAALTPTGSQT